MFKEEIIIVNSSPKIWGTPSISLAPLVDFTMSFKRGPITVDKGDLDLYVTTVIDTFKSRQTELIEENKTKEAEQEIFGTSDENIIKFNIYKTLKNIYDKWVGGADENGENILFQCGGRNSTDYELAKKLRGTSSNPNPTPRLIDSFRFVNRSFKDIGDEFYVNPLPINDYLLGNVNSSFYEVIGSLLSANNFDFIALPSFINYNDDKELSSIFKPYPYKEALESGVSGPSFVCVYVGQTSKNLDFNDSNYPDDGVNFRSGGDGNIIVGENGMSPDFGSNRGEGENNVAVFAVNYGHQNQSIFKDVSLDQGEFTETAESLQIQDDISVNGAESNRSFVGQNIYNVYSVRSYKCEVEMLGNAMIQPMMYFQLNNIPMFHGAYMITKVSHSLKPNFMSTKFSGVRIKNVETPLLDVGVLYMNLLDSMTGEDIGTGNGSTTSDRVIVGSTSTVVPNNVSVGELKDKINSNSFDVYQNVKFTEYGTN